MTTSTSSRATSGAAILDRVFEEGLSSISTSAARSLKSLRFSATDERRMNRLAAKARAGTLTAGEQAEAEQYNLISHLLALLQAKAGTRISRSHRDEGE